MIKNRKKIAKIKMPAGRNFCVPAFLRLTTDAKAIDFRVLFWLADDPEFVGNITELATCASCSIQEAESAIRFWIDHGVVEIVDEAVEFVGTEGHEEKDTEQEEVCYSDTIASALQTRPDVQELISTLDSMFDRQLTEDQIYALFDLIDCLNLSARYITLLIKHCNSIGITSFHKIKSKAASLIEQDIYTEEKLEERICLEKNIYSFSNEVRHIFNAGFREWTYREKHIVEGWYDLYGNLSIIRKAYDITIKATGKPIVAYADSVLRRWFNAGLETLDEIELSYKIGVEQVIKQRQQGNGSFDTDDFFDAAIRKTFRDREN